MGNLVQNYLFYKCYFQPEVTKLTVFNPGNNQLKRATRLLLSSIPHLLINDTVTVDDNSLAGLVEGGDMEWMIAMDNQPGWPGEGGGV